MERLEGLVHEHLFERAPILGALLDEGFRIVEANERFRRVFPDWRDRHCYEVLLGRSSPCHPCHARSSLADGRVRVAEVRLPMPAGSSGGLVTRVAPVATQGSRRPRHVIWMGSAVDEAESLQRENEILFEHVPCYVAVIDRQLRIVRANRRMRQTFGARRGQLCYRVYKRREEPCPDCPALQAFADGHEHTARQAGVTAAGGKAHYLMTAAPLAVAGAPNGSPAEYVIEMSMDVTRQDELQAEVLESERLAAVGQTVAGLAHGVKNILMGIEGGVYVMDTGVRGARPERLGRGLEMLERNVAKMSSLVKNLLAFAKGSAVALAPCDVNAVAREVLGLYADLARGIGVEVRGELQDPLPPAPIDAAGIHTCLANLVSNAIDACRERPGGGGRVTLRTFDRAGVLAFEVEDDGIGIAEDVRAKLFTTFFTTKGAGGTGLGLLMTRKIVHEHGGRLEVEPAGHEGTVFRVLLPRARLEALAGSPQGGAAPAPAAWGQVNGRHG